MRKQDANWLRTMLSSPTSYHPRAHHLHEVRERQRAASVAVELVERDEQPLLHHEGVAPHRRAQELLEFDRFVAIRVDARKKLGDDALVALPSSLNPPGASVGSDAHLLMDGCQLGL